MPSKPPKCLNPECGRESRCRGLCASCHAVAVRLVKDERTSWAKLENDGKASARQRRPRIDIRGWLLGERP